LCRIFGVTRATLCDLDHTARKRGPRSQTPATPLRTIWFRDMGLAYAVGLILIYLLVVAEFRFWSRLC